MPSDKALFHMKKDQSGPARCYATIKTCPNGEFGHHENEYDVWTAYEEAQAGNTLPTMSKKKQEREKAIRESNELFEHFIKNSNKTEEDYNLAYQFVDHVNQPRLRKMLDMDNQTARNVAFERLTNMNALLDKLQEMKEIGQDCESEALQLIYYNDNLTESAMMDVAEMFKDNKNIMGAIEHTTFMNARREKEANDEIREINIQRQKEQLDSINISSGKKETTKNPDYEEIRQRIANTTVNGRSINGNSKTNIDAQKQQIDNINVSFSRKTTSQNPSVEEMRQQVMNTVINNRRTNNPSTPSRPSVEQQRQQLEGVNVSNQRANRTNRASNNTNNSSKRSAELTTPQAIDTNIKKGKALKESCEANFNSLMSDFRKSDDYKNDAELRSIMNSSPNLTVKRVTVVQGIHSSTGGLKEMSISFSKNGQEVDLSAHKQTIAKHLFKEIINSDAHYRLSTSPDGKKLTVNFCTNDEEDILKTV